MPIFSTHIKLAQELSKDFQVFDIGAYLFGAIYPDTRIATGVDRGLLHDAALIANKDFINSGDFQKGWVAHLIIDEAFNNLVSGYVEHLKNEPGFDLDKYVKAIKIVGDIIDSSKIDLIDFLQKIKGKKVNYFNEDLLLIDRYVDTYANSYAKKFDEDLYFIKRKELNIDKDPEVVKSIYKNILAAESEKIEKLFEIDLIGEIKKNWLPEVMRLLKA